MLLQEESKGLSTHHDRYCTAAAVAPLTLREGLLLQTHTQTAMTKRKLHSFFRHETSPLKSALFGIRNPENIPEGPWSSIVSNSSCSCYEKRVDLCDKRVDLATHRTLVQLPRRIQGAMHPGSTLSFEFAALVVSLARTRPARALNPLLFAENKKNEMYARVIRHHDETCGWHVCAGVRNMS